jgi:lambda family phage tail tape measure protein
MGESVGTIFVELDLDKSRYLASQKELYKDATSTTLNIEKNFQNLGIKSAAEMDLMRAKVVNSFTAIANSSKATANDIVRAEKAKNDQLTALNMEQFGRQEATIKKTETLWEKSLRVISGKSAEAAEDIYNNLIGAISGVISGWVSDVGDFAKETLFDPVWEKIKTGAKWVGRVVLIETAAWIAFSKTAAEAWARLGAAAGNSMMSAGAAATAAGKSWGKWAEAIGASMAVAGGAMGKWAAVVMSVVTPVLRVIFILYAAYKALDFAIGLVTGKSYKSKNIDAVIAETSAVEKLRVLLQSTAKEAEEYRMAMFMTGTATTSVEAAYGGARKMTTTTSGKKELDRLGVVYEDDNGKLLGTVTILENANKVLNEYTEGWDRNQAAIAIGMGTQEQIQYVLKVTQKELKLSRELIDAYHLGMGPEALKAVKDYEDAMIKFNAATKRMGDAVKRAISDQVMPAFTTLAKWFSGDWPFAVDWFRYSMATAVTGVWLLAFAVRSVYEIVKDTFFSMGIIIATTGNAIYAVMQGNFSEAGSIIKDGWAEVKKNTIGTWNELYRKAIEVAAAITTAWAFDPRGASKTPFEQKKTFIPPPKEDKEKADTAYADETRSAKKLYETAMQASDAWLANQRANYANEYETISGYYKRKTDDYRVWYDSQWDIIKRTVADEEKRNNLLNDLNADFVLNEGANRAKKDAEEKKLRENSIKAVADANRTINQYSEESTNASIAVIEEEYKKRSALARKGTDDAILFEEEKNKKIQDLNSKNEQAKLSMYSKIKMYGKDSTKLIEDLAMDEYTNVYKLTLDREIAAKAYTDFMIEQNGVRAASSDNFFEGLAAGFAKSANDIESWGKAGSNIAKKLFDGMTDALTDFVMTGKLDFKSLAESIIKDMVRIAIQASITGPLARAAGAAGSSIMSLFGGGAGAAGAGAGTIASSEVGGAFVSAAVGPHSGGTIGYDYIPRYHSGLKSDEFPAILQKGESVLTRGQMSSLSPAGQPQDIKVELINRSGTDVKATESRSSFNGQEYVVTVFLDALNRNAYGLKSALSGG